MSGRAVFLDRDGVLNDNIYYADSGEWEAPRCAADFVMKPRVLQSLSALQGAGYVLFLVSNQPSFAKGKATLEALQAVHGRLLEILRADGIALTEAFYCYHHPEGIVPGFSVRCDCRKPSAYFLLNAAEKYRIVLSDSWMIGDRDSDIECGKKAGLHTIQVASDHPGAKAGHAMPEFHAPDLAGATGIVLEQAGVLV